MICVIQRVKHACVRVNEKQVSRIEHGLLTLLGIERGDDETILKKFILKIIDLRIFEDQSGKMNLSLKDVQGSHLIVSQFTLAANCNSGRRPSFDNAERPELAQPLYKKALDISSNYGVPTFAGIFGADMKIELLNDGPATFILSSKDDVSSLLPS